MIDAAMAAAPAHPLITRMSISVALRARSDSAMGRTSAQ